jgi:hypothetical protein
VRGSERWRGGGGTRRGDGCVREMVYGVESRENLENLVVRWLPKAR